MTADSISADKIKAMRAAFEDAVNSIRSASTLKAVQDAIAAGDVDRLIRILGLDETTFAPLTEALRDSYLTGGQYAAEALTYPCSSVSDSGDAIDRALQCFFSRAESVGCSKCRARRNRCNMINVSFGVC